MADEEAILADSELDYNEGEDEELIGVITGELEFIGLIVTSLISDSKII